MLKLLVLVSISAKLIAVAWASEEEVACTQQTTASYYDKFRANVLENLYPSTDDATTDALVRLKEANDVLMGICLYNQISTMSDENIISIIYPLLFQSKLLALFSNESTRAQFLRIMNLNSMDEMNQAVSTQAAYFNYNIPYNYSSTIDYLIVAPNKYQYTDEFKNTFSTTLGGECMNMDFEDSCAVSDYVNTWMGKGSCSQDYDLLSSDVSSDGLIICSKSNIIVYWSSSFKPSKTLSIDFLESDDNVVTTGAFYAEGYGRYKYDEYLDAEIAEFDLEGGLIMRLTRPKDSYKLKETIFKLRNRNIYKKTYEDLDTVYLQLTVPSESDICGAEDYVNGYKQVNMLTETFLPETNVFSSGFENESGPYVSHMLHKTHVTIEYGQDAETDSEVSNNCETSTKTVVMNSPYIADIISWDGSRGFSYVLHKIPK